MDDENICRTNSCVRPFSGAAKTSVPIATPSKRPNTSSSVPLTPRNLNIIGTPHNARESARIAKLQNTVERVKMVSQLKIKWDEQKKEKLQLHQAKKNQAKELMSKLSNILANQRKINQEKNDKVEQGEAEAKRKLLAESLAAHLQMKKDIAETAEENRRQSLLLHNKMREEAIEKENLMKEQQQAHEAGLLESKRLDVLAKREANKMFMKARRESLMQRGIISTNQRKIMQKKIEEENANARKDFEMKRLEASDVNAYKKHIKQQAQNDVKQSIEQWKEQKQRQEKQEEIEQANEISMFTSRHDDWVALQAHQKTGHQARRQSLMNRLAHWREERCEEDRRADLQQEEEEIEMELRKQEYIDVQNYRKSLQEQRRNSMIQRGVLAQNQKLIQSCLNEKEQARMVEEFQLRGSDKEAVRKYTALCDEQRRASLQFRNQKKVQEKRLEEAQNAEDQEALVNDCKLKREEWQDVQNYIQSQRDAARKSLANRIVQARQEKEKLLELHQKHLATLHEQLVLRHHEAVDVASYKSDEKQRQRLSLAYRLDSWKTQKLQAKKREMLQKLKEKEEMLFESKCMLESSIDKAMETQQAALQQLAATNSFTY